MVRERGSVLLLVVMGIMILSIIISGLLNVGTTEIQTTQNHLLNKKAYYYAVHGLEEVFDSVRNSTDPTEIKVDKLDTSSQSVIDYLRDQSNDRLAKTYYTGNLEEGGKNVSFFEGFPPPPLPKISLGDITGLIPIVYKVPVTSEVIVNDKKRAYTEIITGVYALMKNY